MDIMERIKQTVESQPIVLFMKGTPQFPMCGFSSRTVQALKASGAEFHSVNVLEDPEIRANLPRYSNWPTFPQLFINGELIGGCDITLELYEKGDLMQPSLPAVVCPDDWPALSPVLAGKVVLLTGASGGLGQAFARHAAAAGAELVLVGRRVAALERLYDDIDAAGGRAALYPLNLAGAGPDDYRELAERVVNDCGGLDALVLASAHLRGLTPIERTPPEDWLTALHVGLSAPFQLIQHWLPLLRARDHSAIVMAVNGPDACGRAYWGGYGVVQAGLAQLATILADELEDTSVSVHAVDPGPMRTGLRQRVWFSEDPGTVPTPDRAAAVLAGLVGGAEAERFRGRLLRLAEASVPAPLGMPA